MRTVAWALVAILILMPASPAFARTDDVPDHWPTFAQCEAASGWYEPSIVSNKPLKKDEVVRPHPTGACMEIDLPDRLTKGYPVYGRGWVRIPPLRNVVYGKIVGTDGVERWVPRRLAQCDNEIFAERPFEKAASSDSSGGSGAQKAEAQPAPSTPGTLGAQAEDLARREAETLEREQRVNVPVREGSGRRDKPFYQSEKFWVTVGAAVGGLLALKYLSGSDISIENTNNNCNGVPCKP